MRKMSAALIRKLTGTPAAPAYSHTMVTFDGTADYLVRGGTPTGFIDARYMTIAFKIKPNKVAGTLQNILHFGAANARIALDATNKVAITLSSANFPAGIGGSSGTAMTTGQEYTCHFAIDMQTGSSQLFYLNGVSDIGSIIAATTGDAIWSTLTNAAIGAATGGTVKLEAGIGFFWFTMGNTTDSYITDATKFYNGGDVNLGTNGTGSGLTQPVIFWGGSNNAAHWNAGINAGSGADTWTMNGAVA